MSFSWWLVHLPNPPIFLSRKKKNHLGFHFFQNGYGIIHISICFKVAKKIHDTFLAKTERGFDLNQTLDYNIFLKKGNKILFLSGQTVETCEFKVCIFKREIPLPPNWQPRLEFELGNYWFSDDFKHESHCIYCIKSDVQIIVIKQAFLKNSI